MGYFMNCCFCENNIPSGEKFIGCSPAIRNKTGETYMSEYEGYKGWYLCLKCFKAFRDYSKEHAVIPPKPREQDYMRIWLYDWNNFVWCKCQTYEWLQQKKNIWGVL